MNPYEVLAQERAELRHDEPQWEGFERRRWANGYAAVFGVLFAPLVALWLMVTNGGKGHQVGAVQALAFVIVTLTVGLFLGRAVGWRLERRHRLLALGATIAVGVGLWVLVGDAMLSPTP